MTGQLVEYPFAAGLDEGSDPRRTPKFLTLENYVWTKRGRIEKRPGYQIVSSAISPFPNTYVASAAIVTAGSGYTSTATVSFTGGGSGIGAAASVVVGGSAGNAGQVASISVKAGGFGYSGAPTPTIVGAGSGATASATVTTTAGGGSLAGSYSIRPNIQGVPQLSDGSTLYVSTAEGWTPLAALSSVQVTTTPAPVKTQVDASGPTLAANWLPTMTGAYLHWWNCYVTEKYATRAVVATTNPQTSTPNQSFNRYLASVSDGINFTWGFRIDGAGHLVFDYVDVPALQSFTSSDNGYRYPDAQHTAIPVDMVDACWSPTLGVLIVAYVVTGGTTVTIDKMTWNASNQGWDQSNRTTIAVDNTASAFTLHALSVCAGPNNPNGYVAWAYMNTVTNALNIASYPVGQTAVYNSLDVLSTRVAKSVGVVESDSANYYVTVCIQEPPYTDPVGGTFTYVAGGLFVSDIYTFRSAIVGGGLYSSGTGFLPCAALAAKPFAQSGRVFALVFQPASSSLVLQDVTISAPTTAAATPGASTAYVNPRVAAPACATNPANLNYSLFANAAVLPAPISLSATQWLLPATYAAAPAQTRALEMQHLVVTFGAGVGAPADEETALVYPAGVPSLVSEASAREVNFMSPPQIIKKGTSSGALTGDYSWVATYAWLADDGSIIESPPSAPVTISGLSSNEAVLYVSCYGYGQIPPTNASGPKRPLDAWIILYRTLANQGGVYYRVSIDPFVLVSGSTTNRNWPQYNAIRIIDNATDTVISANTQLYTGGGVFDNVCPAGCTIAARVRDRVYLAGTPDGFTVYYSDPVMSAGAANFHDEQAIVIDDGGRITGLAALDAVTLVFKSEAVFAIYGSEGTNTGNGNTISPAQRIPTGGIGCTSTGSIVTTAMGVFFQSERGIEVMDRSLAVTFVGEPVKDETASATVVSALVVQAQYQIRFVLSTGVVLVYSTLSGEWSRFTYAALPSASAVDACNIDGAVWWVDGLGNVMQETVGSYTDGAGSFAPANITATAQSGWITLAELEGFRRYRSVQLLGTYFASTGITATIYTDYSASGGQSASWNSGQIAALPEFDANRVQLEIRPSAQKAEAVSIKIVDSGPIGGAHTRGIGWDGFAFEVVTKPGRYRKLSAGAQR